MNFPKSAGARGHRAAEVGEPRLHLGIGESGINLFVELADDLGWRVPRRADAIPAAHLISRHEFAHGWDAPSAAAEFDASLVVRPNSLDSDGCRCSKAFVGMPPLYASNRAHAAPGRVDPGRR
jgi:hypothetical protein